MQSTCHVCEKSFEARFRYQFIMEKAPAADAVELDV